MERALDDESVDLAALRPRIDALRDSISQVSVVGQVTHASAVGRSDASNSSSSAGFVGSAHPSIKFDTSSGSQSSESQNESRTTTGEIRHRINFGAVAGDLNAISSVLGDRVIWLLLDEWSEIPLDLQPYLADLLRRTVFPARKIVVKIAAIEQRTNF